MITGTERKLLLELAQYGGEKDASPARFDKRCVATVAQMLVIRRLQAPEGVDLMDGVQACFEVARDYERKRVETARNRKLGQGVAALIPDREPE